MPAATNKADLMAAFDKELAKLRKTLATIDETSAKSATRDDDTTIKGIIAHRIHWVDLFFHWYETGKAGKTVHVPAEGYKWNELKAYNAPIYARGNEQSWAELTASYDKAIARLRAFIEDNGDDELYTVGRYDWTGKWGVGRWIESAGPAHFRSANTYIRKVLREAAAA